jgi:hypothetical protein
MQKLKFLKLGRHGTACAVTNDIHIIATELKEM